MPAITRRKFVGKSATDVALAGLLSAAARELHADPIGIPVGSQTYPHRQRIKDGDFAGLCKDMAGSPACPTGSRPGKCWRIMG